MELYCLAEVNEQTRITTVADIINDVRNPLEGATQFDLQSIESCEKVIIRFEYFINQCNMVLYLKLHIFSLYSVHL